MNPKIEELRVREKNLPTEFPEDLKLRLHRAVSWLLRAENQDEDDDAAFIFYWVAFNALYGMLIKDVSGSEGERTEFQEYFRIISLLDTEKIIYDELWHQFSASIRILFENKYVYSPFWNHHYGMPGYDDWEMRFEKAKELGLRSLKNGDTAQILSLIFDRLYVLRNQVFHGAATWKSSVNRAQIKDARRILGYLLPLFIDLMMKNPNVAWGEPGYAVVD